MFFTSRNKIRLYVINNTFIYEPILMKIDINATFYWMKYDLRGHWSPHKVNLYLEIHFFLVIFFVLNLILLRLGMDTNIIKTQIFHIMKFDLIITIVLFLSIKMWMNHKKYCTFYQLNFEPLTINKKIYVISFTCFSWSNKTFFLFKYYSKDKTLNH